MKTFHSAVTRVLGIMIGAILLCGPSASVTRAAEPESPTPATTVKPSAVELESWRREILKTQRPGKGCFTASYPDKQWREVPCKTPSPHKLYLPQHGEMSRVDIVGGTGPDFSAVVTGNISEAEGSFDSVTGVNSTNPYSLQLNTAPFPTLTCTGSPNPAACQGWQQFVYDSSGISFIQYWLLNYGPAGTMCPTPRHANCQAGLSYSDGWCPFQFASTGPVFCVINAVNEPVGVPSEPMTSLGQLKVTGTAASGATNDAITVWVGGTPHSAAGDNRFPDLGNQWHEVEFNVFGDGNGSQAVFNAGSKVVVRTAVTSGTTGRPRCDVKTFTGESSNLTLISVAPRASKGSMPALVFSESFPAPTGVAARCADKLFLLFNQLLGK